MGWWTFIKQFLLALIGMSKQVAENKGERIEHQAEAIRERSETVAGRENNKQERLKDVIPKERIAAEIRTLQLRIGSQKRLIKLCHDHIEAGHRITDLYWVDSSGNRCSREVGVQVRVDYLDGDLPSNFLF